jgi:hypothetical protein
MTELDLSGKSITKMDHLPVHRSLLVLHLRDNKISKIECLDQSPDLEMV